MTVTLSPEAESDLVRIWAENADLYGSADHADQYVRFLVDGLRQLEESPLSGRIVEGFPQFRYLTLRKSRRGHGHYVIYLLDQDAATVSVLRILHTRMDVQDRLRAQFD